MKVLLKRFHLNGHITGFHPQTQKLEQLYETQSFRRAVKVLKIVSIYNPGIAFKYENQSFAHPSKMSLNTSVRVRRNYDLKVLINIFFLLWFWPPKWPVSSVQIRRARF